jgi:hypothetical protein
MKLGTPFTPPTKRVTLGANPASTGGILAKNKPSLAKVIAFGGIPKTAAVDIRSSDPVRSQPNADATQMECAVELVQRRDDYKGKNLNQTFSIMSFSNMISLKNPNQLGCHWGKRLHKRLLHLS